MHLRRRTAAASLALATTAAGCLRRPAPPPVPAADALRLRADGWACIRTEGSLPLPPGAAFARGRAAFAAMRVPAAADSATGRLVVAGAGAPRGVGTPGQRAARLYFAVAFDTADSAPATADAAARGAPRTRYVNEVGATGAEALPRPEAAAVYAAAERFGERFWAAMGYPAEACHGPVLPPAGAARPPLGARTAAPDGAAPDRAAPDRAAIRRGPGWVLEVLGLRRWTLAMLEDSLAKHAPGTPLASSACAAALRYRLGFADAAVVAYRGGPGDSASHVVVMVVEPGDSARVRHRPVSLDTLGAYAPWRRAVAALAAPGGGFDAAVATYPRWRRTPGAPAVALVARDPAAVETWRFLAEHATAADARTARALLGASPDYRTRAVAAAVLANALADDAAVYALVGALRQSDGPARGVASAVLGAVAWGPAGRPVAWGPAGPDVHALLDGTSPFYALRLLPVLVATGAGPADAPAFLRDGGTWLLAALQAEQPALRAHARALLTALRGADLGPGPAPWRAWVRGL
jgi:hypothetical protein